MYPVFETKRLHLDHLDTPIGRLALLADDQGRLHAAGWLDGHPRMERLIRSAHAERTPNPRGLTAAIAAYFAGDLAAIDHVPTASAGTPFQRAVWGALRRIPGGETRSYGELARAVGRSAAVRAVGRANGCNPVAVVVPCHRVIGADGALAGYAAGAERKRWLLDHERKAAGVSRRGHLQAHP